MLRPPVLSRMLPTLIGGAAARPADSRSAVELATTRAPVAVRMKCVRVASFLPLPPVEAVGGKYLRGSRRSASAIIDDPAATFNVRFGVPPLTRLRSAAAIERSEAAPQPKVVAMKSAHPIGARHARFGTVGPGHA